MNGLPPNVGTRDFAEAIARVGAEHPIELVAVAMLPQELQLVGVLDDLIVILPIGEEHARVGVEVDHEPAGSVRGGR